MAKLELYTENYLKEVVNGYMVSFNRFNEYQGLDLQTWLHTQGFDWQSRLDHIALKAGGIQDYQSFVDSISDFSDWVVGVKFGNREIATARLTTSVESNLGEVKLIEVIQPKLAGSVVGIDHMEFIFNPLDDIVRKATELNIPFVDGGNKFHRTIVFVLDESGKEIKFSDKGLNQAIIEEGNDFTIEMNWYKGDISSVI